MKKWIMLGSVTALMLISSISLAVTNQWALIASSNFGFILLIRKIN